MTYWAGTINRVAKKLSRQTSIIEGLKNDIHESRKTANEAAKQVEELAQYTCSNSLEISGISPNEELSCEDIVRSVGNAIGVAVNNTDISVTHIITSLNTAAPPNLIDKFTRMEVRDRVVRLSCERYRDSGSLQETHVCCGASISWLLFSSQ